MDQFNTEAMKLGTQGITVMVSSGDDGVAGDDTMCDVDSSKAESSWPVSETVFVSFYLTTLLVFVSVLC